MEDMARLAVFEQSVRNLEVFNKTLLKLSHYIQCILDNPLDYNLRCIESETIAKSLDITAFTDYLTYIGFQINDKNLVYPNELNLNKLRMSLGALQRKLRFSNGTSEINQNQKINSTKSVIKIQEEKLLPVDESILNTNNAFLKQIVTLFNDVLKYEDPELQREAREHIPLVTLELKAIDRMRDHQRKIKAGETTSPDLPYDMALLMELMLWFKYRFFSWVDAPACERCAGATRLSDVTTLTTETETCRLEVYRCASAACGGGACFPRHNDPRALLQSRRGRCGEWAACFTLLSRALGYDTRYVHDVTDHVWCEVYDAAERRWTHVDPCEARADAPLLYERGWGKALSYVVAVSRDDVQDVTWRYTSDHAATRGRRARCAEPALAAALVSLRAARQAPLRPARRAHLAQRALRELVDMMTERQPTDAEVHGRLSGARAWRSARGEAGRGHSFEVALPGDHSVTYSAAADRYLVTLDGREVSWTKGWESCVFAARHVFRNVEHDWRMVYLAREEGEPTGSVSWRVCGDGVALTALAVTATAATFESGAVDWTLQFDDEPPMRVQIDGKVPTRWCRAFTAAVLTAALRGGGAGAAWQHAQLFRQPLADAADCLAVTVSAAPAPQ